MRRYHLMPRAASCRLRRGIAAALRCSPALQPCASSGQADACGGVGPAALWHVAWHRLPQFICESISMHAPQSKELGVI
jgi:hypothetical protein